MTELQIGILIGIPIGVFTVVIFALITMILLSRADPGGQPEVKKDEFK